VSPKALEFCILTATRTGETVGARWPEINLAERVWIIPGTRMKAGKEHRIPLSDRAIAILESLPREANSNAVFIGDKAGSALSTVALWMTLRRMGRSDITTHGFRSTFKDWAGEQTSYANELTEMALAHVVSDKTEAAYRRGDMVAKRRHLMEAWAKFCEQPARSDDNVVSIRSAS
jgi:integrase